jgi:ATPase subunit of ABC transporter with duplicated ATPase domains
VTAPDGMLLFKIGKQFICQGDRIILLGRNGTGKTRLVSMLRRAIADTSVDAVVALSCHYRAGREPS